MDHTRGSMSSWKYAVGPAVNSSCTDARTVPNHARNPGLSSLLRVGPVHSSEFSYAVGKKGIRSPFACFALWSRGDKGSPLSVTASVSRSGVPSSVRRGVTSCAKYFVLVVLGFWLLLQLVALRTFWTSLGRQLLPTHSRQEGAPPVAGSSPPRSLDPTQGTSALPLGLFYTGRRCRKTYRSGLLYCGVRGGQLQGTASGSPEGNGQTSSPASLDQPCRVIQIVTPLLRQMVSTATLKLSPGLLCAGS